MDVLKETRHELTVEARPNRMALTIAGVLLFLAGLLVLIMTETAVSLDGRRSGSHEGVIEFSTSSLIGSKSKSVRIEDVSDVVIERGTSRGTGGVVIQSRDGNLSLAALSSGRAVQLLDEVKSFLDDPTLRNLHIARESLLFAYTMGPALALLGLLLLALTSQRVRYTIDKAAGRVALERKSVFGTRKAEYALQQIASVQTQWASRQKRSAVVWFVLNSGQKVHAGWPDRAGTVNKIREFLELTRR